MKRTRRHKCRSCQKLFTPNYRNGSRQHYCQEPACQSASKKASQKSWLHTSSGRHYHSGPEQVERVRGWRKVHPGYWRRGAGALQDSCASHPVAPQAVMAGLNSTTPRDEGLNRPLQDDWLRQSPLFVGFISQLTGALQDDIASQLVRFQTRGQQILGKGPGIANEGSLSG